MIIVLFHVICLVGKFVYQKYQGNKQKSPCNVMEEPKEVQANPSDIFRLVDPTNNDDDRDVETTSLRFHPPAYIQRYTAVTDVLTGSRFERKLRKVVDFGCSELGFLNYLKNIEGVQEILCVDIDSLVLELNKGKAEPLILEYVKRRPWPLVIELCKGSVADSDKKLEGTDAVVCIELIEHLYPEALTDLPYNIFGYIEPQVAIITTPNADFNVLFPNFTGFRHYDHKFEWTRQQFQDWAENVVLRFPNYEVTFHGICYGPKGTEHLGACSQMAVFTRICDLPTNETGVEGLYKTVELIEYPYKIDNRSDECKILDEALYHIAKLSYQDGERLEQVPLSNLVNNLEQFSVTIETLRTILVDGGRIVEDTENGPVVLVPEPSESDLSDNNYDFDDTSMNGDIDNDWDMGIGPIRRNSGEILQRDISVEDWDNKCWDEPSIIIPQQNYEMQNTTNLLDDLNTSVSVERAPEFIDDYESNLGAAEMPYYPTDNIRDISTNPALPNILNPGNGDDPDRSLDYFSVSSNAENLKAMDEPSQSPEPYLRSGIDGNKMLRDNPGMSTQLALNSTFHNLDISTEEDVPANNPMSEEDEPVYHQLEKEQDVYRPHASNFVGLNEPQFTSSPKPDSKVCLKSGKRRSLVYPGQLNSRRQEELEEQREEINAAMCRLDTITLQDEEAGADSSNTIGDSDTSASIVTVNEQDLSNCSSLDKKRKLNSSIDSVPDASLTCSSFDCALKNVGNQSGEEQIGSLTCDIEGRTNDSCKSTKETILRNAVPTSTVKSLAVLTNDEEGLTDTYIRKRKSLRSPEDNSEGITDSGYPNSASTQGTPTECDFPDIEEYRKSLIATETHCSNGIQSLQICDDPREDVLGVIAGKSSQHNLDCLRSPRK